MVNIVGQAGIALCIRCRQVVDLDGRAVRHDNSLPDNKRAALTERNDAVIGADQARTLRNEKRLPRHRVVDVLRDLGDDETRQIGIETCDEAGRDQRARHHLIRRNRVLNAMRVVNVARVLGVDEIKLALHVTGITQRVPHAVASVQPRDHHRALSSPHITDRPDPIFKDARLKPFLDQADDVRVADPVLQETDEPCLVDRVEEVPDVRIENVVHLLAGDPDYQGIQRIVLSALGSEPVRETVVILTCEIAPNIDPTRKV